MNFQDYLDTDHSLLLVNKNIGTFIAEHFLLFGHNLTEQISLKIQIKTKHV